MRKLSQQEFWFVLNSAARAKGQPEVLFGEVTDLYQRYEHDLENHRFQSLLKAAKNPAPAGWDVAETSVPA